MRARDYGLDLDANEMHSKPDDFIFASASGRTSHSLNVFKNSAWYFRMIFDLVEEDGSIYDLKVKHSLSGTTDPAVAMSEAMAHYGKSKVFHSSRSRDAMNMRRAAKRVGFII